MKESLENKTEPTVEMISRHIQSFAYEMRDDRNDGWMKSHYRDTLKNIRDKINKALEQ
jgi:hypothetical protein